MAASDPGGTLRVALAGDPATLDPRSVRDPEGELIVAAVFEPLVRVDPDGQVLPGAARSWEVSEDGTTFTFELRASTFHDGTPVRAQDFAATFAALADRTRQPMSLSGHLLDPIVGIEEAREGGELEGVEALDDRTLRITLQQPWPRYLLTLSDPTLVPVPASADEDGSFAVRPIGNGPFAMAEAAEPGQFVRLTALAEHHRRPFLDEVVLQIYPDDPGADRQWQDLGRGLLHVADVGASHHDEAVRRYGTSEDGRRGPGVLDGATSAAYLLGFRLDQPPYDDPQVRRAISQSIDRDALAEDVFGPVRSAADRIVPPGIPGSQGGACDHCRTDPEGAAALLEDAEVDLADAGPLVLAHHRSPTHAAVARRVAADVGDALDVEVEVETLELEEYAPSVAAGELGWFRLGWEVTVPDPGAYLHPLFHSDGLGTDNLVAYVDEETDQLLDEARAATDRAVAVERFQAAERRILDAVAVAPLLIEHRAKVVVPEVRGLVWDATGRVDLAQVRLVEEPGEG